MELAEPVVGACSYCLPNSYDFFLLDNSAMNSVEMGVRRRQHQKGASGDYYKEQEGFVDFLTKHAVESNIYFSKKIFEEFEAASKKSLVFYKSQVKERGWATDNKQLNRMGGLSAIISAIEKRESLIEKLREENRIITLNQDEEGLYRLIYQSCMEFKYRHKKLSGPDWDFLITGYVLSVKRAPTALISNDYPIMKAWEEILREKRTTSKRFGFFVRVNNFDFKKAFY